MACCIAKPGVTVHNLLGRSFCDMTYEYNFEDKSYKMLKFGRLPSTWHKSRRIGVCPIGSKIMIARYDARTYLFPQNIRIGETVYLILCETRFPSSNKK